MFDRFTTSRGALERQVPPGKLMNRAISDLSRYRGPTGFIGPVGPPAFPVDSFAFDVSDCVCPNVSFVVDSTSASSC